MREQIEQIINRFFSVSSYSRYDFVEINLSLVTLLWLSDLDKKNALGSYPLIAPPPGKPSQLETAVMEYGSGNIISAFQNEVKRWEMANPRLEDMLRIDPGKLKAMNAQQWQELFWQWKYFFNHWANSEPREAILAIFECLESLLTGQMDAGENFTPKEVVALMLELVKNGKYGSVYDPYCRTGNILSAAQQQLPGLERITGIASADLPRKLASLRILIQDPNIALRIESGRAYTEFGNNDIYDLVLMNPPFGTLSHQPNRLPTNNYWASLFWNANRSEIAFLCHGLDHLKSDGKLAIVVPNILLSGQGVLKHLRKMLIECNLLEAVITLPAKVFRGTGVSTAILLIDKKRKTDRLLILDAAAIIYKKEQQIILNLPEIVELLNKPETKSGLSQANVRFVTRQEIISNDYDLQFATYRPYEEQLFEAIGSSQRLLEECDQIELELEIAKQRIRSLIEQQPNIP